MERRGEEGGDQKSRRKGGGGLGELGDQELEDVAKRGRRRGEAATAAGRAAERTAEWRQRKWRQLEDAETVHPPPGGERGAGG